MLNKGFTSRLPKSRSTAWPQTIAASGAVLIGAMVVFGWILGIPALKSVLPGLATMKFNTALGLMVVGGGLLLVSRPAPADAVWKYLLVLVMGAIAALLGLLTLVEYFGVPLRLDELFISDSNMTVPSASGRMSPATAVGIACAGVAVMCLAWGVRAARGTERRRDVALAHLLAAAPASIGYLSLAGYVYGAEGLYSFGPFVSVAIHTAVALVLLASAILLTQPDLGWRSVFADRPVALSLLGRLLAYSVVIPFVAGLLVVQGGRHHIYDALFGPALIALAAAVTSIALTWIATTEVRRAEGRMRESEAQLHSLVDSAADGIVVARADGLILSVNRAALVMFGYDQADELVGRNLKILMPAAEAAQHDRYIASHREGAPPRVIGVPGRELLASRRDGSQFPIDLSVSSFDCVGMLCFTGIIRDATNRRQAETALAEAEARFRGIFDSQFQYIILLAPNGTILEVNRTALDAGGLMRNDVIGQPLWVTGWWPVADRDRLRTEIIQAAQGVMIRFETEINSAGGGRIWIDFSLKPVRDPETGAVTSLIAEGRDLTEKRGLVAQLVQTQKVQALGQLAAGIAHDFNNILQAVSGAALLIEQRPGDRDSVRHLARTAIAAANRGTAITERLLSFARRGDLRANVVATAEWLNGLREVLARTLGTTITVRTSVSPGIPSLIADQAQLETAIINLATNARDAMPDGSNLILSANTEHVAEGDHHPADLAPGDYVRLVVADNGTGMDAATLARVSEPFFTTKPAGQGTGLGVAMAKGFAEQSGGGLSVGSAPGKGTKVAIWLRQAAENALQAPDNANGVPTASGPSARILVVDDDDLVRETVAAQLEAAGFATLVASSGIEALALIESGEVVDAMVTDLSMPGISGTTTIQRAHVLRPRLPCFLLTGYAGERAALSNDNAFVLVRKPVAGPLLAAQIKASLEGITQ